jgi:NDP-sugar pyrophosphorylase family protein
MKAVILCQGTNNALLGLDEHQPGAMLPLGDRPFLQHVVEYAILAGARECTFIVSYLPEKIESYFGDGSRWGCRFSYQLATSADHSWRMLRSLCNGWNGIVLLAQSDIIPATTNLASLATQPTVVVSGEAGDRAWTGWASFDSTFAPRLFAEPDMTSIAARLMEAVEQGKLTALKAEECIDCRTPEGLIRSQRRLTAGELPNLMLNGNRAEQGICIGHGVSIHPTASLRAPLYVGPNSRIGAHSVIGPGAVVSENCIVDAETSVVDSLITPGTYIGEGLELDGVIVDRNRLVNSRLATSCLISESCLFRCH